MNVFLRRVFFLRLLLPLVAGIAVENRYPGSWLWLVCLCCGGLFSSVLFLVRTPYLSYTLRWTRGVGLMLACFSLGVGTMRLQTESTRVYIPEGKQSHSFRLLETQRTTSGRVRWLVAPDVAPTHAYLYPSRQAEQAVSVGNRYRAVVSFRPIVRTDTTGSFDFALWAFRRGITHAGFLSRNDTATLVEPLHRSELLFSPVLAGRVCRTHLVGFIRSLPLDEDGQSVLIGLMLGDKQSMNHDVKERFRLLGISHLLAVSGLHVGILFAILLAAFRFVERGDRSRLLRYGLVAVALWVYAAVTGFSPSVTRASLMCSLYSVSLAVRRPNTAAHTLTLTAFVLLIVRPSDLFDVGFQLSFAAVAFLLLFLHLRSVWWPHLKGWSRWIVDFVTVSTGAQVGTLPLTLYYFGSFQPLFLFSNLLAVPLIPLVMLCALGVGVLAGVGLEFAFPLFVLRGLLGWLTWLSEQGGVFFAHTLVAFRFDGVEVTLFYLFLCSISLFLLYRRSTWFIAALALLLLLLSWPLI